MSFRPGCKLLPRDLPTPIAWHLLPADVSYKKRDAGAYSTTAGPYGPRRPARASSRTFWVLWTSRSGGCLSAPAFGDFGTGPRSGSATRPGSTPQAHRGTPYSLFLRSVATHDIAAARGDGGGRGLLDLTPPTGILPERRPLPRQVLDPNAPSGQRREHDDTAGDGGDKLDLGKCACMAHAGSTAVTLAVQIAVSASPGYLQYLQVSPLRAILHALLLHAPLYPCACWI